MKNDCLTVDFEYMGQHAIISLYSKFTQIYGDSGEGKSEFIARVINERRVNNCRITASNDLKVILLQEDSDIFDFSDTERKIYVIDEIALRNAISQIELRHSNHYFICVSRSTSTYGNTTLKGHYRLKRTERWYTFVQDHLPLYKGAHIDHIITEAADGHSEHELLGRYMSNLISARGRDNIAKVLRKTTGSVLVMADLGNVGNASQLWMKRCRQNPDIYFYDYLAFEELLYESPLVSSLPSIIEPDKFLAQTLERYYEKLLEVKTKGSALEYEHGKPLANPYLDKANFNKIFDSEVGRALIPLLSDNNSSSFNAVEYLQNKAGNKFKYFTQLQINNCKTQEDCDELLQSLRWLD